MVPGIGMAIAERKLVSKPGIGLRLPESKSTETAPDKVNDSAELRLRNRELEREVREGREREEEMRRELDRARGRLLAVEEAEERLCAQLGELEAEAMEQAMEYNRRIRALSERLAEAQRIIANGVGGCAGGDRLVAVEGWRNTLE
ncbi:hypothetical protein HPP92_008910 [Vanilla planifolia]|uniref:Uncharacterized protein n=1 Tax=Vanilla planifolia TaxID=51239 RepID=A0A835R904_VANPL|nr:hypothetical protein HPP92_008910 [Vanilla planifolia]